MAVQQDLAGKVILITGASRGIGYAAGVEAARRGAHVVAVARTVGGLEELDDEIQEMGSSATLVPLDLRDGEAIDRLGAAIFERWGHLDGVIGNAGQLGVLSPWAHIKPEDFEKVMTVNVTANYRLIRSVDLLLRQAPDGRAVFVSSGAARSARPFWGLYAASKAALDAMVKSYAGEIENTRVRANSFNPGPVRTAMRAKAMPGENPETLPTPAEIAPKLVDLVSPGLTQNGQLFSIQSGEFSPL
ncbi:SDR family NAD(P)-dependent oxidoreductase [Devosia sp. RR2S18]|uniref:SDR family NAD(P)-dependent oxidoreductase n=1 Tax=Devosia rhizosphaerae TaxID=3049774 RepID=UPI002540390B|nr:SDR family NAD(P)-dependent oxidoreductase [Devosia sp. RR2S18]WIJ24200.1 SDR family NAD(P)-dependent oxidoreductase [Devosia sp. RR2S18]